MEAINLHSLRNSKDKLGVYIASIKPALQYAATFIPQSQSRNKDSKDKLLNWKVKINNLETDYMQGIGHIPNYNFQQYHRKVIGQRVEQLASENGIYYRNMDLAANCSLIGKINLPIPKIEDVLHSLVMDADVLNYNGFDDWASNFGYDTDSIKDNKLYQDCIKNGLALRNMLGDKILNDLQVLFQDY